VRAILAVRRQVEYVISFSSVERRTVGVHQQGNHDVPAVSHRGPAEKLALVATVGRVLLQLGLPFCSEDITLQDCVWLGTIVGTHIHNWRSQATSGLASA
jgi:hypothetical protein